ncbi:MAG: iron-containing alcohol dehydrogenase [Nitrospinota bacterium]
MRFSNRVWFGPGSVAKLEEEARGLAAKHALVITDKGIRAAGLLDRAVEPLRASGAEVEVYDDVEPEPPIEVLERCHDAFRKERFDLVVGVGGGSSLDVAKSMSALLTNGGNARDYLGIDLVPKPGAPAVLVPTTAGTGAEATPNAIFSIEEEKVKKAIVSSHIIPRAAILDPDLTLGLPPAQTAASGVDALTHCLETYVALNATPLSEMFSLEGMRLISRSIRKAVANGRDLPARTDMLLGSYYGGVCLAGASAGAIHALSYPLGGRYHVPHGVGNAMLFPHVMEFNYIADLEKFAAIAEVLGEEVEGLSLRDAAEASVDAVRTLCEDVGVPTTLRELNVDASAIPELAEAASQITRLLDFNPRRMTKEDIARVYERATG